jgi:hypothetical protein
MRKFARAENLESLKLKGLLHGYLSPREDGGIAEPDFGRPGG